MNYPVLQVNKNGQATTSVFSGINRLPEGAEGEGAEFCNLSLDLYPAASTAGLSETNETVYIKNSEGADEAIDLSLLQAVADIADKDGVLYLTGVYNGEFYYEGNVAGYYLVDNDIRLTNTDIVKIRRCGNTYTIIAVKDDGESVILSYNTEPPDMPEESERKKRQILLSQTLKFGIPTEAFVRAYIHKIVVVGDYAGNTRIYFVERRTQKQYYFLYMYHNYSPKKYYRKNINEEKIYDEYDALAGIGIQFTASLSDFDKNYYCFNDSDAEHPVKFVIDAASSSGDVIDRLIAREKSRYSDTWTDIIDDANKIEAQPFYLPNTDLPERKKYDLCELDEDGLCSIDAGEVSSIRRGVGIIGHFEKWNEEEKRYEYYCENDEGAIWRRISETGENKGTELRPWLEQYRNGTWSGDFYDVMCREYSASHTLIPVKTKGFKTESATLSHMAVYKGRIFATVNDGSMIIASALGDYTDFSEFQGVSTDSGYFNSLTAGKYTGISEYQGTLVVFKADRMSIYYGDTPSDMVLSHEIKNVGCIDADSIKECAGMLIFLGKGGFYAYTGGQPQCISRKLAKEYKTAKAFVSGRKYYAEADGELLIYDTDTGAWTSSNITGIKDVCGERIFLSDGRIMKTEGNADWSGEWVYESMDMFEDMTEDKGINEIYIRAKLQGKMTVKTITDGEEREHMTVEDDGERMKVWRVPVRFLHGNYYRIRLEGDGKCILYAVERRCYAGGKKR